MSLARLLTISLLFSLGPHELASGQTSARVGEIGLPYLVDWYSHQEYGAHHQNWSVTQDHRGIIYVGNSQGVLEYDGATWRLIRLPHELPVRSLDTDGNGRVFVGSIEDFGYLGADSSGAVIFHSLAHKIPEKNRDFADVWGVHASNGSVYFHTYHYVYEYRDGRIFATPFENTIYNSFKVRGEVYFYVQDVGLIVAAEGGYLQVPGGKMFSEDRVFSVLPYGVSELLVATRTRGLFVLDSGRARPLRSPVNEFFRTNRLYHGSELDGRTFAYATLQGGVIVINENGDVIRKLDEQSGLLDNTATFLFRDREGGLWITLNDGITRIDALSAVSSFDRRTQLEGALTHAVRHHDKVYVSTSRGIFYLQDYVVDEDLGLRGSGFHSVQNFNHRSWHLLSAPDGLWASTDDGVFLINDEENVRVREGRAYSVTASNAFQDRVYVAAPDGVGIIVNSHGAWREIAKIPEIDEEILTVTEEEDGTLWLSTWYRGIIRLVPKGDDGLEFTKERFDKSTGLPESYIAVLILGGLPAFMTDLGTYRFDAKAHARGETAFVKDRRLDLFSEEEYASQKAVAEDSRGNIWISHGGTVSVIRQNPDGTFTRETIHQLKLPEVKIRDIFVEDDGVVWLGADDRLIRYDHNVDRIEPRPYPTLIRQVIVNFDLPLYQGAHTDEDGFITRFQSADMKPVLTHKFNALRFSFAATSFVTESATQYQYMLEGFDPEWSAWSLETRKDYTNLPRGDYRFRVRAQNRYGFVSEEAVYAFSILPPWYETWWAYTLYVLGLMGVILSYGRYRSLVHASEMQRELAKERLVNERLQQANALLQEADKLKDEFLANTSHELRTPLAAILGFASVLREEVENEHQEFVELIEQSGNRLLHTLNSLLDLAKLRANMMEVRPEVIDVVKEAHTAVRLLKPLAIKKRLYLHVEATDPHIFTVLDRVCLERILNNLIGNAIKFTNHGGVTIEVERDATNVYLRVRDTGMGINKEFVPFLFDEFRQQSSGLARSHEGSGLGLSITKRMVDLMNGNISVKSEEGVGTTFAVTFPRTSDHEPQGDGTPNDFERLVRYLPERETE